MGNIPKTVTARFLFICLGVYLLDALFQGKLSQFGLFSQPALKQFEVWRLLTPAFFHTNSGQFIWVLISFYIFYSLGNFLESSLGDKRFLNLLICSVLGHAFLAAFVPVAGIGFFDGILSSIFLAYGLILGAQKFKLMLFFILPLTLSGHMLVGLTIGLISLQCLMGGEYWRMGIPMLGGCAAVYIFISQYQMGKNIDFLKYFKRKPKAGNASKTKSRPYEPNTIQRNFQIIDDKEAEMGDVDSYIKDKVDPILEKIAKSGMGSLSKAERKILENAKKKIGDN